MSATISLERAPEVITNNEEVEQEIPRENVLKRGDAALRGLRYHDVLLAHGR